MILKGLGKALARNLNRELHYGLRGITKDAFNDQLGLLSGTKVQTIFNLTYNTFTFEHNKLAANLCLCQ
jgi:hypothetical protein